MTIAYADIFEFPLTVQEIVRYCIGKNVTLKSVKKSLSYLLGLHADEKTFISLSKRDTILATRRQRSRESSIKWRVVSGIARWLTYIPSIMLIGVTGALAMGNAGHDDDIDLFIVTREKTLWVTRILTVLLVETLGNRRHPNQKEVTNSICLNMFVSEDGLAIARDERDIYTAHEAMQMIPVWETNDIYEQFIGENTWIRPYLPNWWKEKHTQLRMHKGESTAVSSRNLCLSVTLWIFRLFEPLAKRIQLSYMQKRRTNEVVGDNVARFHPRDTRAYVREQLSTRLKTLKIPLDNVFHMSIK
jgi:hypothetical protein